ADCSELIFTLSTRILTYGFNIDFTLSSLIWCKLRLFLRQTFALTVLACICLATIDRYLLSCQDVHRRRLSKILNSRVTLPIVPLFILVISSPLAISMIITVNKDNQSTCTYLSTSYLYYSTCVYNPLFLVIIPVSIMTIFGLMTYNNLRQRRITPIVQQQHRLDQQLTSMLLLQIVIIIVSSIPYCVQAVYAAITVNSQKDSFISARDILIMTITSLIFFLNNISNFYIYLISSPAYRKQFIKLIKSRKCFAYFQRNRTSPADVTLNSNNTNRGITFIN
ncbi:unnamed protein product, partial [Didymodactylos carnosus]